MLSYDEISSKIVKQFLCNINLHDFKWHDIPLCELCSEQQINFWSRTVNSDLVLKYPIKYSHQYAFWKYVMSEFAKNNANPDGIPTELYDSLINLQNKKYCDRDVFYKHYVLGDSRRIITLEEFTGLISHGTTGLRTWEGSRVLAEWAIQNPQKINSRKIMELGAGVGLTGIVLHKVLSPSYVYVTDCHWKVLELLERNVKLNVVSDRSLEDARENTEQQNKSEHNNYHSKSDDSFDNQDFCEINEQRGSSLQINFDSLENTIDEIVQDCKEKVDILNDTRTILKYITNDKGIEVLDLPWGDVSKEICETLGKIDIVMAADIIYDPSLFGELLHAMDKLSEHCQVEEYIFACTVRNEETLDTFLKLAGEHCFLISELPTPEQENFTWPSHSEVKLLSLRKAQNANI